MVLPPLQLSETTASTAAPQYFETPVLLIFSSRRFGLVLVFCSVLFSSRVSSRLCSLGSSFLLISCYGLKVYVQFGPLSTNMDLGF